MPSELQDYVEQARDCQTLLAAALAPVGVARLRARLRCDEAAASAC